MKRQDDRTAERARPVTIECDWHGASDGSVLYRAGRTVVLCTASVDEGVKDFLRGKGRGWVTAEYVMHPRSGVRRQSRDGFNGRPLSGRAQEISRLIGRALRAAVDPAALGERTITVDCDVLESDSGTRTASVTGGMVALALALAKMRRAGAIALPPLRALIAAVSAGIVDDALLLDLVYVEDRDAAMDLNLVATDGGEIVEIQATAEQAPVARDRVEALTALALAGTRELSIAQRSALAQAGVDLAALGVPPRG